MTAPAGNAPGATDPRHTTMTVRSLSVTAPRAAFPVPGAAVPVHGPQRKPSPWISPSPQ
jgi:hypothetical protein